MIIRFHVYNCPAILVQTSLKYWDPNKHIPFNDMIWITIYISLKRVQARSHYLNRSSMKTIYDAIQRY